MIALQYNQLITVKAIMSQINNILSQEIRKSY